MAQAIGVYTKLLVCKEASFKQLPETLSGKVYSMPFNSISLAASQNTTDPATITGRRDSVEAIYGNIDNSGDVVVPLGTNIGYWLALALGAPTTTAVSGKEGYYKHVFKASNTQPSFAIEKVFNNGVNLKSIGCKVSKLAFSFGGDGELTATVSVVGCNETIENSALVENPTAVTLHRFNNFQSSLIIGTQEEQIATEVTCDVDMGLDTEGYAIGGNGFRVRANEGIIKPSGSITVFFDNATYLNKAMNSEEVALEIALTNGDNKLQIIMPEVKFNRTSPSVDGPTGITQQMNYNAYYGDNAQDACIVFVLTDNVASYDI